MSFAGLQIGRSALSASQAAIQVAGNNMANAATEGYTRRTIHLAPSGGAEAGTGFYIGQGVHITAIQREVDEAMQARFRDAMSDEQ